MVSASRCQPSHPQYDDFQTIVTSVSGVVYLGTPHAGSQLATYGMVQSTFYSMIGRITNPKILQSLELDAMGGKLGRLQSKFQEMRDEDKVTGLKVFYFWETEPCKIGVCLLPTL
jgi:hypothetical protein